jgi:hypothetical protein
MYEYILGVVTSYADSSLVQSVALLSCRLERGGGVPVPMAWVPSVLGGMICSYSFTSVACETYLHEGGRPASLDFDREEVVIGPANVVYDWMNFIKQRCTAMVLLVSGPMLELGSRKGGCTRGVVLGTSQYRVRRFASCKGGQMPVTSVTPTLCMTKSQ